MQQSGTESSGAARPRLPLHRIAAIPLGTLFIGSTLVAFGAPAWAAPAPDDTAPTVTLIGHETDIKAEETATLTLAVNGEPADGGRFCLFTPGVDNGFEVHDFVSDDQATDSSPASAAVTGEPEETVDVTATVDYAPAPEGTDCAAVKDDAVTVQTAPVRVTVEPTAPSPDPTSPPPSSPPPSTTPPEEEEPSDPPSSPTSSAPTSPPEDDRPSSTATASRPAPPHSPVTTSGPADRDADDRDRPELPTDAPELPPIDPGGPGLGDGDLADLPTVEPGDGGDGDTSAAAASEPAASSAVTPAVLLLFLLLLLLLTAPLSPTRRVRIGGAYKGRRRRS
ncbi:hypothetical protein ACFO4E_12480 [Nocardiopsis mangrovi]|uniref:Uncharacterized protein n=1 Tax=Nocardiopsis mangrovi TaxID=1179818 RepID=A0ABV9DWH4_9ACTN